MKEQNRGKNVALAGAILQAAFTVTLVVVYLATGSSSAWATAWMLGGGIPLWLMVANLFYCRKLRAQEEVEMEELAKRAAEGSTLFEGSESDEVRPAAARVRFMEKWVVPIFTVLWAMYHVGVGLWLAFFGGLPTEVMPRNTAQGVLGAIVPGFVAFLMSFYALGMARQETWRLLRAAGSYLFVSVLPMATVAAALLAASQGYGSVDRIAAVVIPFLQLILAVELLLGLLLDLYRPRVPGRERRMSFDSRLYNLVADPGRVGHSIAEMLNYQFGFEVSSTWFYRLLGKALIPMIAFGVVVMMAASSIVIVEEGEQAVVKHWGRIDASQPPLQPGLHFKWPWPVDRVDHFDVRGIHEVRLGVGERRRAEARESEIIREGTFAGRELYLWSKTHGRKEELDFLIAVAPDARDFQMSAENQPPPVSVIKLVVLVQYRITDVVKYAYQFTDARKLLENVAYREMIRYCASATLDRELGDGDPNRPEAIMTVGRGKAGRELHRRISDAVGPEGLDLGVEVLFVSVESAHPPAEAAEAFEEVLQAERNRDGTVYLAEAWANRTLARVAGEPDYALELAHHIRRLRELEDLQQLHGAGDPEGFERTLESYIDQAKADMASLGEEIGQDMLSGEEDRVAFKQRLRGMIFKHLEQNLMAIRNAPDTFAWDGRITEARHRADKKLAGASGSAATLIAMAKAYRWNKEMGERGRSGSFQRQVLAYNASPNVFKLYRYLDVLDEVLPTLDKYILAVPREKVEVRLDWRAAGGGVVDSPFMRREQDE
jgi:regulator of protease activity HflC (stomatin/prohibitin superfamily)